MYQALSKSKLSLYRKYLQKKTRQEEGRFLLEGWHLLDEALRQEVALEALIFDEDALMEDEERLVLELAQERCPVVLTATSAQLKQLSDTKATQGVVALAASVGVPLERLLECLPAEGATRLLVLDAVSDPGNVGAIVRACAWFGMDGVILGRGCAELENGKTARATMGGLFHLPIACNVDLGAALPALRSRGIALLSAELQGGRTIEGYSFPERAALVVGNEARGVAPEFSSRMDEKLFIPRFGAVESLNAALAAAVLMGAWRL